ncbi:MULTISPECIES: rhodanese-like domain-containing protein [Thiorhodovibrio]|jgi:rhodanese-related sulfurtransferase|uniref:rhodanese-like domain-containing protein n=1 Tax=Thiorhodovibrio TaxID=61593 RepID=UPI00191297DC|nr:MULTISPECIES: rhodanese-like domain-containing protein [Thiorhodovibrio]MBK5970240.1 sulfurtransferase [Thiorhodovibrio winogradskyi]WPL12744.1 putative adenylyltransferase/sulfurtransferase MoeZ [Thiorhodovibrio litoralis]
MQDITPKELSERLATGAEPPLLLDVREPWEAAICQIPGSRLIPMREIPQHSAALDANRETVVICHHGVRSLQVALYLERSGYQNILNLQGGIAAWAEQVDPQMATY